MPKIAVLYDAGQAILSTFDLDEVLQRILTIAHDYFHLPNVAILLLDPEAQQLCVRSQIGWDPGKDNIFLGCHQGITGASVVKKQPVYAPDVSQDPRYVCAAQSTRSELAIPLMVRDEVVGVLDCQSDQLNHFNHETIELLTLFSTQASIALQNARLYALERQRARQLEAINAIAQQSTAVMDLEDLLSRVCLVIQQAFQVSHASLFLREEGDLVLRAHEGTLTPCIPPGGRLPADREPWSRILATGGTLIEKDLTLPNSFKLYTECASRMGIPLISFGQTLGVLTLHSSQRNAFRESELQSLESVADICASSIQNAHYVERIRQLSYLDGLTGIFNRRFFELRIMEEIERARRCGTGMAVVMVDIDQFKKLNDEFGHLLGDEVLRQVSSLFHQQLRKIDVVCRYGGEEFAILLTQTNAQHALGVAEKLRRLVEGWQFSGVPRTVTLSAGVAAFPDQGTTRDELIRAADTGLYAAKQGGRNRVCVTGQARPASAGR
ncbi:MAG TPA: sensor domain-containing diguanylate cyclase [Candidatus Sulfotelmatobacter sp.]|jgi:diguanylate cyclase (GGDEF)-like protein|nr:sensor domain-containing diguanylate cyclase [Candidatus Sulfotelmatobacter sp.]